MVTSFQPQGRLGNQMFSLAFSYLLAERLNVRLAALPLPEFPNTYKAIMATQSRENVAGPVEVVKDTTEPFDEIVARCQHKQVWTHGWFERAEFYLPHRRKLRDLYGLQPSRDDQIVFSFRGTDKVGHPEETPLAFYLRAWESIGRPTTARICSDDPNYHVLLAFCDRTGIVKPVQATPEADFKAMLNAGTVVVSYSTFAWWAAFLSEARVIQPEYEDDWCCRNHTVSEWTKL